MRYEIAAVSALADHHRAGDGPPLLLIHGFTGTWRAWGPLPELLAEQFDVLAPTVAGPHGRPGRSPTGIRSSAIADGLEAMLDEVGLDRPHVAGWSMGGQLSLELAKRGRALSVTAISPRRCPWRRLRRGDQAARPPVPARPWRGAARGTRDGAADALRRRSAQSRCATR